VYIILVCAYLQMLHFELTLIPLLLVLLVLLVSLLYAWQVGGAILNYGGGTATITGSEFVENTAEVSGALCTLSWFVLFFKCFISN